MAASEDNCRFRVISLSDAVERRAHIAEQFGKHGIDFAFFDAVDARTLEIGSTNYMPHVGERWTLTTSQIAVFESHRRLWQLCVDRGWSHIVVFEDDVVMTSVFRDAYRAIADGKVDHDVIKLDWHPLRSVMGELTAISERFQLGSIERTMPSAAAYVVSRSGALKLLNQSLSFCDHLDDFVFCPRRNWRQFQLVPPIAVQAHMIEQKANTRFSQAVAKGQRSSITGTEDVRDRAPTFFRVRRELRKAMNKADRRWRRFCEGRTVIDGKLPFDFAIDD